MKKSKQAVRFAGRILLILLRALACVVKIIWLVVSGPLWFLFFAAEMHCEISDVYWFPIVWIWRHGGKDLWDACEEEETTPLAASVLYPEFAEGGYPSVEYLQSLPIAEAQALMLAYFERNDRMIHDRVAGGDGDV